MDYSTIKKILEKYWEGDTSLKEEAQLRQYFNQAEVAADLKQYQPIFIYQKEEQLVTISEDFEDRLKRELKIETKGSESKQRKIRFYLVRAAAAAVFVFGLVFMLEKSNVVEQQQDLVWEDTYEDPEEAYLKAKEVLMLLSSKMNKGTGKAASSMKKASVATEMIKE